MYRRLALAEPIPTMIPAAMNTVCDEWSWLFKHQYINQLFKPSFPFSKLFLDRVSTPDGAARSIRDQTRYTWDDEDLRGHGGVIDSYVMG